jgi:hypothetical protein
MSPKPSLRVSVPNSARVVDPRDPYTPITSQEPRLYGDMVDGQPGECVCVTFDGGRVGLVMRSHLTVEAS